MRAALLLLAILSSVPAMSGQLYVHTVSVHVPRIESADETNWGLAYRWDAGPRIGTFENSHSVRCWYGVWVFRPDGYVHPWLGAVRGYSLSDGDHLDDDSTGIGSDATAIIPLVALEVDVTRWLRDRHWWPKKIPDIGLVMVPWVVNLEVQF